VPARPDAVLLKAIDAALKTPAISASLLKNLPQLKIDLGDVVLSSGSDRVLIVGSKAKNIDPVREIEFAKLISSTERIHLLLTGMTEAIDGIAIERKTFVQLKDRTGTDYNASRATPVDEFIRVWGKTQAWSGIELYVRTQAPRSGNSHALVHAWSATRNRPEKTLDCGQCRTSGCLWLERPHRFAVSTGAVDGGRWTGGVTKGRRFCSDDQDAAWSWNAVSPALPRAAIIA
jgi:hypothetical protein